MEKFSLAPSAELTQTSILSPKRLVDVILLSIVKFNCPVALGSITEIDSNLIAQSEGMDTTSRLHVCQL